MATMIVLGSGNLMSNTKFSKRMPILPRVISKKTAAFGLQGQPLHVLRTVTSDQARRAFLVYCVQPGNPPPPPPKGDTPISWQQWIFGIITTIIVPFFNRKWTELLKIKDEVDMVVEETEEIVDFVEEVAETVDKVVKDVADHLPEGGKWRNAAVFVEGVAEEIAREAQVVEDFLHEFEETEEKVQELLVETVNDKPNNADHKDLNSTTEKMH